MGAVVPENELGIAFSGAVFFGIYLLTLASCLRWQLFTDQGWHYREKRNWPMITITLCIFILVTLYLSLSLYEHTLLQHNLFNHIPSPLPTGKVPWSTYTICFIANSTALLADIAFIYRCWLVYGRSRRIIIIPVILWMAGLLCTVLQAYWQIVQSDVNHKWKWVNMSEGPGMILTPFWATTLVLNAYIMSMIIYRIRDVTKHSYQTGNIRGFRATTRILVECGFLYFSTTIAHFIVWWTPNDLAIRVASNINIPTIGIAFNLILIRVGQNRAEEKEGTEKPNKTGVSEIRFEGTADTTFDQSVSVSDSSVIVITQERFRA